MIKKIILYTLLSIVCIIIGALFRFYIENAKEPEMFEEIPLCHADSLRLKAISTGDIHSYLELRDSFESSKFPHEVLFYAMVMAKQYGYQPAYQDVCKALKSFYDNPKTKPMDSFTDSICQSFMIRELQNRN